MTGFDLRGRIANFRTSLKSKYRIVPLAAGESCCPFVDVIIATLRRAATVVKRRVQLELQSAAGASVS